MKRFISLSIILLVATSIMAKSPQADNNATYQLRKLNQFYLYLSNEYIEEIDMEPLVEKAIKEILLELDPHSSYINAEDMKSVNESFDGEFSGIGVEFNILNDTIIVVNTIVGAPAESVGIAPNDRIITVDGESVVGVTQNEVPKYLRGVRGSKVAVEVVRHTESEPLEFIIERDNIPINTVDASYLLSDGVGYIKVNRFGHTTFDEFREAYYQLGDLSTIVLDLRGNGGGLLNQAVDLANFFLPRNTLIVSTEDRNGKSNEIASYRDGEYISGNVVVLIDEDSASASEIVAGALQDWDRAVIIGRPSFGKGLVQRQFELVDGSVARITVAKYHTPSGRVIQRAYKAGESKDYFERHIQRYIDEPDSLPTNDAETIYKTLRMGRKVYGGGGITPDILVKVDTTPISKYYISLIRKSVVNEFVVSYLDSNRDRLISDYPTFEQFNEQFVIDDQILDELMTLGENRGVEREEEIAPDFREIADMNLKALFAQKLFSTTEFYRVVNESGNRYFEALNDLLENWDLRISEIVNRE